MVQTDQTNNYSLSTLLTLLGSLGLALVIILLHAFDLGGLSEWLLDLVYGTEAFLMISQMISGNGYLFQCVDRIANEKTFFEKINEQISRVRQKNTENAEACKQESFFKRLRASSAFNTFIGLTVGLLSAVVLTVVEVVLHAATPFGALGKVLGYVIMFIGNLSLCGGLGNRTGRAADYFNDAEEIFRSKDVNYALSIAGGILIGVLVIALVVGLMGVTVISGGAALPVALFCTSVIGGCASASGYIGRVFDFVLGKRTLVGAIQDEIKLKKSTESAGPIKPAPEPISQRVNKENVLTAVGVGVGIALGIILIVAGILTLPLFGLGLPKLVAGFILVTTCISAGGGFGNRLGYALQRKSWKFWEWGKKPKMEVEQNSEPSQVNIINSTNLYAKGPLKPSVITPPIKSVDPVYQSGNTNYGRFLKRSKSTSNLLQATKSSNDDVLNQNKYRTYENKFCS